MLGSVRHRTNTLVAEVTPAGLSFDPVCERTESKSQTYRTVLPKSVLFFMGPSPSFVTCFAHDACIEIVLGQHSFGLGYLHATNQDLPSFNKKVKHSGETQIFVMPCFIGV